MFSTVHEFCYFAGGLSIHSATTFALTGGTQIPHKTTP